MERFNDMGLSGVSMNAGSVHGRFQPFHNGHLNYVLTAQKLCEYLWIGITKCDMSPIDLSSSSRLREKPENNPLTFFERIAIIGEALIDAGINRTTFGFVPFPIETPERLQNFMPTSIPCYTTVCEQWNEDKITILEGLGYSVSILYREQPKRISGYVIREDIVAGGDSWKVMVPQATARAVESLNLRSRLLSLRGPGTIAPTGQ
jgi:cytidyltransferase-like protein